jgi:hypothetical protein
MMLVLLYITNSTSIILMSKYAARFSHCVITVTTKALETENHQIVIGMVSHSYSHYFFHSNVICFYSYHNVSLSDNRMLCVPIFALPAPNYIYGVPVTFQCPCYVFSVQCYDFVSMLRLQKVHLNYLAAGMRSSILRPFSKRFSMSMRRFTPSTTSCTS